MVLQLALQFLDDLLKTGHFSNGIRKWQCWHRRISML